MENEGFGCGVKIKGEQKKNKAQAKLICQWIKGRRKRGKNISAIAAQINCTNSNYRHSPARGGIKAILRNFISQISIWRQIPNKRT